MTSQEEYAKLDDIALIGERAQIREKLMDLSGDAPGRPDLEEDYRTVTAEFDSRARAAWSKATR
jgi:hypothetical protein